MEILQSCMRDRVWPKSKLSLDVSVWLLKILEQFFLHSGWVHGSKRLEIQGHTPYLHNAQIRCVSPKLIILSLFLSIFLTWPGLAQSSQLTAVTSQTSMASLPASCAQDVQNFCGTAPDPKAQLVCLRESLSKFDSNCRQEVERLIQMRLSAEERGGAALTAFGGPGAMGPPLPLIAMEFRNFPGEKSPALSDHRFYMTMPIFGGEGYLLGANLVAAQVNLGNSIKLDTGPAVPGVLHRYELGVQYLKKLEEKRSLTLRFSGGYAGDDPSVVGYDASYSASLSYSKPGSEKGVWIYLLFMSNNSPFLNYVPIPGIIYLWKSDKFTGSFGFPLLSLQWTPQERWSYALSLFGTSLQSEVAYGDRFRWQTFFGYQFNQQAFIPSRRERTRDRLTLQDQKVVLGYRFRWLKRSQIEVQTGRSFDRSAYVGDGFLKRNGGQARLDDDWFGMLNLRYGF